MRHLGVCLLALVLPAAAAAFTVDRAIVRISPSRSDQVRLAGRLQGVEVEGATQIRLAIDGVGFTLDVADFTRRGRRLRYRRTDDTPGIDTLTVDLKRKRYRTALSGLALDPGAVVTVQLSTEAGEGCALAPLLDRKAGRRRAGALVTDRTRPRRLVLAPSRKGHRSCALSAPSTDPAQLLVGDPGTVHVRVLLDGGTEPGSATVSTADAAGKPTGPPLCTLADDGDPTRGDTAAGDGVYACAIVVETAAPARVRLVARATAAGMVTLSPPGEVRVVGDLTDDDVAAIGRVQDQALSIWEAQLAEHGDGTTARLATLAALRAQPGVARVRLSDELGSITIEYDSGVVGGLALELREDPPVAAVTPLSRGSEALAPAPTADVPDDAMVVGNHDVFIWDTDYFGPSEAAAARDQFSASTCPRFNVTYLDQKAATLDSLSDMTRFGTVVLVTHGDSTDGGRDLRSVRSNCMLTCDKADAAAIRTRAAALSRRELHVITGRVDSLGSCRDRPIFCVDPAYFRRLPGRFPDSLVWGGFCFSGLDFRTQSFVSAGSPFVIRSLFIDPLVDVFVGKGVGAFLGFNKKVSDTFPKRIGPEVFTNLLEKNMTAAATFRAFDPVDHDAGKDRGTRFVLKPLDSSLVYLKPALTPKTSSVRPGETAALSVTVEGADDCTLAYHWKNTGSSGHLSVGDDVESTSATATYQANPDGSGVDTVTVAVIDTAASPRRTLFTLTATVIVSDACVLCQAPINGPRTAANAGCPGLEACCRDGRDNDEDGATDCDDADCTNDPACQATTTTATTPPPTTSTLASDCPGGVQRINVRGESCCPSGSGNSYYCGRFKCTYALSQSGPGGCDLWCDLSQEGGYCSHDTDGFPVPGDPGQECCCTAPGTSSCVYP